MENKRTFQTDLMQARHRATIAMICHKEWYDYIMMPLETVLIDWIGGGVDWVLRKLFTIKW